MAMFSKNVERILQAKIQEIKKMLNRYVFSEDWDRFCNVNAKAIQYLAEGRAISSVMVGFSKKDDPQQKYDARIELRTIRIEPKVEWEKTTYGITPVFYFRKPKLNISQELTLSDKQGTKVKIKLADEDVAALKDIGRLNHTVKVGEGKNAKDWFIAIDRELNSMVFMPTNFFKLNQTIKGAKLTEENKQQLMAGEKTLIHIPVREGAKVVPTLIYFNPVLRNVTFEKVADIDKNFENPKPRVKKSGVKL
jgi:hypothetical protein